VRRRCEAKYTKRRWTEGYAETPVWRVERQYHGGRDLVATLPRSEKRAARLLVTLLNELAARGAA
jgi:hypothetical protein